VSLQRDVTNLRLLLKLMLLTAALGCDSTARLPTTQPAVVIGPTPLEVARAYTAACNRGDVKTALSLSNATTPVERDYIRAYAASAGAMARLKEAIINRFGPESEEELIFGLPSDKEFDTAFERIQSDTALVLMAEFKNDPKADDNDSYRITHLTHQGNVWLVQARPDRDVDDEGLGAWTKLYSICARSAASTLTRVQRGEFQSALTAQSAFQEFLNHVDP
jgi:hypothetical protein